ncbi:hypothetical protein J1N35_038054 [Gossypium stocksii]|uniref:Uncharacterized protein n=1 Tax=Gossypium stocksii TaxID=47602 RepID=A0A9D3ZMH9_9ROSI|nr:hypothetical protein J1N35_038054 [Gossypium stocksii]
MKLEVERLQLNISAAERDRTLLSIGTYPTIVLDALVLDYVRVLISSRRRVHADTAAYKALDEVTGSRRRVHADTAAYKALDEVTGSSLLDGLSDRDRLFAIEVLKQLLAGEESLAEFPLHCSFIDAVSG